MRFLDFDKKLTCQNHQTIILIHSFFFLERSTSNNIFSKSFTNFLLLKTLKLFSYSNLLSGPFVCNGVDLYDFQKI